MGQSDQNNDQDWFGDEGFKGIPSTFMGLLTSMMMLGAILGLVLVVME